MHAKSLISTVSLALGLGISTVVATTFPASAFTYNFGANSQSSNSSATGAAASVKFEFQDLGSDRVQIDLEIKNTTGEDSFGAGATTSKLTGIAFDMFDGFNLVSSSLGSELDTLLTDVRFQPFSSTVGNFNFAIADNTNFEGGNANGALAQGSTNTVSLVYSGLGDESIESLRARYKTAVESESIAIAARFQQVNAGAGSDKLLGGEIGGGSPDPDPNPTPEPAQVPEPGSLLGFGLLAGGTLILGKRKRVQKQDASFSPMPIG